MIDRLIKVTVILLVMSLGLMNCAKAPLNKGRGVTPEKGGGKDERGKPSDGDKDGTLTCPQQWEEFAGLMPQGRSTTYQESEVAQIKDKTLILKQNIIHKEILENNSEKVSWKRQVHQLAPETGDTQSQGTMTKINFIELCDNGVAIEYRDRPRGYKPNAETPGKIKFQDKEYEVVLEKYVFSKSSRATDKDELLLWIGTKAPYLGLLFKSERKFFRTSPAVAEVTAVKELQEYKEK